MIKTILLNPANLLSVFRVFLSIPLAISVNKIDFNSTFYEIYIFLFICFLIALSDILDGFVARKFNFVTDLGKILDPIADKICVLVAILFLCQKFWGYFFILFLLILIRDLAISGMTIYFVKKKNIYFQANKAGKYFLFFIGITMILFIIDIPSVVNSDFQYLSSLKLYTYYLTWFFFILSSYHYLMRYIRIFK